MSTQVRLAVSNDRSPGRACATCRYLELDGWPRMPTLDHCGMFSDYADIAREFACKGDAWEAVPPRLGFFPWVKTLLFGGSE